MTTRDAIPSDAAEIARLTVELGYSTCTEEIAGRLLRLIDALEDNDDVGEVHGNFDVDAAVLERVAG